MSAPARFKADCPLLFCFEEGPHEHPVCDTCAAVNYGNATCPTCKVKGEPIRLAAIARLKEERKP